MQIGFYKENQLQKVSLLEGKTSDTLLPFLEETFKVYKINKIIYTNGPGSYMATKITYVLLKTLQIIKDIELEAVDAFSLNENKPIKALGKLYFIKEKENIITKKFDETIEQVFFMPKRLENLQYSKTIQPQYFIGAV